MANTRIPGTIIRSGSIPTTALGGGVVSSSAQVINHIDNQKITPAQITASGHIVPSATEIYDLGSSNLKFRDLYLSGSTIYLGTLALSDSGGTLAVSPSGSPAGTSSPVSGAFTGSFFGDIFATNGVISSSAQVIASLPTNTVSSSAQVTAFLPTGTVSSSGQVDITNTTNYTSFSSSIATIDTTQTSRLAALEDATGSYATTGSNTFVSAQTISDTTNSTSYLDGALHVAGGMSVRKDVRVSGSLTVNGLLTAVSMSTQYVTASEYNVGVSKITLNDDDTVRFAGISIYDSGSSSPTSASIYWDSLQHRFIYENLSGSAYNSSIIIAGPKHTGSLGDEPTLTSGYIPVATGTDHIDNSVIYQSGSNIGIGVTNTSTIGARVKIGTTTRTGKFFDLDAIGGENWIIDSTNTAGSTDVLGIYAYGATGLYIKDDGNVGIGTASPTRVLTVYTSGSDSRILLQNNGTGTAINNGFDITMGTDGVASVWNYQNSYMRFATNNTERMRIDASGSLLVGGTSTAAGGLVQIQSSSNTIISVRSTDGGGTAPGIRFYHDNNDEFVIRGGDALRFFGSGVNERVVITGTGDVGIGTTNPSYKLDVRGEAVLGYVGNRYVYIDSNANVIARGESGGWAMAHAFRGSANTDRGGFGVVGADDALTYYWIGADYSNPTMVLTSGSAGNVGINTTSPNRKLVVYGTGDTYASIVGGTSSVASLLFGDTSSDSVGRITYDNSNDSLTFLTDSGNRMFISSAGNVGIGTTNPQFKLHTVKSTVTNAHYNDQGPAVFEATEGQIQIISEDGGSHAGKLAFTNAPSTGDNKHWMIDHKGPLLNNRFDISYFTSSASGNILAPSGTEKVTITTAGNVGIGTTNPSARLNVAHPNHGVAIDAISSYYSGVGGIFSSAASSTYPFNVFGNIIIATRPDFGGFYDIVFTTAASNNTPVERMVVKSSGNVGIGTTNPSTRFHVSGSTANGTPMLTFQATSTNNVFDWMSTAFASNMTAGNNLIHFIGQSGATKNAAYLGFRYAGNGSNDNCLTLGLYAVDNIFNIFGNGNVAIGSVTAPSYKFEVNGTIGGRSAGVPIWADSTNSNGNKLAFLDNGTARSYLGASSTTLFTISNISGVIKATFDTSGNLNIDGVLTEASSIGLKENINPITDALSIIKNITGYTYDRRDGTAKNQSGFIAEEIAQILPGVVSRDQDGNPSGVQYTKIIAYLVESIKELKSELDELKSR